MQDKIKVIVAGGGTGGHLYPAIALVKEIERRFPKSEILFFGTSRGLESKILPAMEYRLKLLWLKGFQRRISFGNLILPIQILVSLFQCAITMLKFKPDVVIGTGGYVSGPAIFLAAIIGFPTLIQEQNSYPGISTRFLSRFVDQVHLSFEDSIKFFKNKDKIFVSGNPIRTTLNTVNRNNAISKLGIDGTKKTLLILGGSQGAHSINQAILNIIDHLIEKKEWQIIWGSGERDWDVVQQACSRYGSRILVKPFISDMASVYAITDLVVSRAGATTLAELQVCGLPSVLVPFPFATAGHQEANARALVELNAADMVLNGELNTEKFMNTLLMLMENENRRKTLGMNLKALAKPDAAERIIEKMIKLISNAKSE